MTKRTIESVLDFQTGKEIIASNVFSQSEDKIFNLREELEKAIQNDEPKYVCYFCKQKLKIRGGGETKKIFHFAHLKDSDDCHIKTDNKYTKEEIERIKYNGAKESVLHFELKSLIASNLEKNKQTNKGVEQVWVEKVVKSDRISKEWKKPDVSTLYKSKKVVFELQLSTTFLSAIVARQEFYKANNTYIIWVFNKFETEDDKRKFTQSDVFYSNNQNGFELDEIAQQKSLETKDLILHCYYRKPLIVNSEIEYEWNDEYISLNDLTFNNNTVKTYFYDVENEVKKLENELSEKNILNSKETELLSILNTDYTEYLSQKKRDNPYLFVPDSNNYKLDKLVELFKKRYKLRDIDKQYIKMKYKLIASKLNINEDDSDMLIIWTVFLAKMENEQQIETLRGRLVASTAFHLLSLKLGKVISYNFDNLISQLHLAVEHRKQHLELLLKAIKHYKREKMINELDIKGKFNAKINKYLQNMPEQDDKNNDIFKLLFKELF